MPAGSQDWSTVIYITGQRPPFPRVKKAKTVVGATDTIFLVTIIMVFKFGTIVFVADTTVFALFTMAFSASTMVFIL
jgi:hypothetical protein